MHAENKHRWEPTVNNDARDYKSVSVCKRCNCIRMQSKFDKNYFIYSRGMASYGSTRPDCFGSVPINEQTID